MKRFGPRQLILSLFGDYMDNFHGEIGIGTMIELLQNFKYSKQSIRSAVSRMYQEGMLKVRRHGRNSYYSLTETSELHLKQSRDRIFTRKNDEWDGTWNIVVYFIPEKNREARDKIRQELVRLGYGPLSLATWISPYDLTKQVSELVKRYHIKKNVLVFQTVEKNHQYPRKIIYRCWDIARVRKHYETFIDEYSPKLQDHLDRFKAGVDIEPNECFAERANLVNDFRNLVMADPDLPLTLLPKNWPRPRAVNVFNDYHQLLVKKAESYYKTVSSKYNNNKRLKRRRRQKAGVAV